MLCLCIKRTLLDDCFSSNVVDRKHCVKNVTGGQKKTLVRWKGVKKD